MFIGYILFAFVTAFYLCRKTELKILTFLVTLRILAEPSIRTYLLLSLPGLPFSLQPDRILFLVFFVLLIFLFISKRPRAKIDSPAFEKSIWLVLLFVSLSIVFNRNHIPLKETLSTPLEIMVFITLYYGMKHFYTKRVFRVVMVLLLILAGINAVIAIIQITAFPSFLKIAEPRLAFGALWRASGIFVTEYQLGYILNMAIAYTLLAQFSKKKKIILVSLFLIGLICTFHRLNWLICIAVFCAQMLLMRRFIRFSFWSSAAIMVISMLLLLVVPDIQKGGRINPEKEGFVSGRLMRDTVSGRLEQYKISFDFTLHNFWGVGSYENKEYYKLMARYGMLASPDEPLGVHNGYLAMGVMYGPLAAFSFLFYLFLVLKYFYSRGSIRSPLTYYPFLCALIWALANLSNRANDFRSYHVVLLAMFFGLFTAKLSEQNRTDYER